MKCSDIKRLLSEYVDDTLDETTRSQVDQHLQTCESCQREYVSLKNIIHETGSLPRINAPDHFLENLHARMDSGFSLKNLARNLFVPFKIKIPLELVTATAAAVLIFFFINIYQRSKPLTDLYDARETAKETTHLEDTLDAEKAPRKLSEDKKTFKGDTPAAPLIKQKRSVKESIGFAASKETKKQTLARGKAAPAPMEAQRESASPALIEKKALEKPIELALLIEPAPARKSESTIARMEKPAKPLSDMESEPVLNKKTTADESNAKDTETVVATGTRGPEDKMAGAQESEEGMLSESRPGFGYQQTTAERIKSIIQANSGRVISVNTDEQTGQPTSILAEIPSSKFRSFYSQLSQMGTLKQPAPPIDETKNELLRVKVQLITSE